jgi:xylan 1,4-beta-xylosidase
VRRVRSGPLGVYDNANFGYRNTEYFPVFQCKLMKKLLDLDLIGAAQVHLATTWSFYFEGERFFEGTRSLFTAGGIEKPVLNAYRMLGRLGDTRLAAESSHAWSLDRLDDGEAGMPEEIDAVATSRAGRTVQILLWRHADDQYATDAGETNVSLRVERLSFGGDVRVSHTRIDARHSNSHTAWRALGSPQDPSEDQLRAIRDRQGLEPIGAEQTATVRNGALSLRVALPLPSVSLVEIAPAS